MKAAIRGTEIYFDIDGMQLAPQGNHFIERPVLFMLHGGPGGDHQRFKQHSLELKEVAQLVFVDHRGCGRSKRTRQADYTLENNIEDLEALRKHLGLKKICILGTSYGGMVAQGYAIRYPRNVEKLILVVTAPSYRLLKEGQATLKKIGTAKQNALAQRLWQGNFKNNRQLQEFFKATGNIYSALPANNHDKGYSQSPTIWSYQAINEAFGGFLRHFDFIPHLKKIRCPTLILAGDRDWICSPEQSKTIAKHIPHSKLHILKNCGHAIATDAHDRYIKLIQAFMRKKSK